MKRKWIIWVSIILVVLCFLVVLAGGVAYYLLSRPRGVAQAPVPVVEVFYPPNLSEVPYGSIIPVGVEASVPEGHQVSLIQLWVDGELIGELEGSSSGLTASWGWVPLHDGETTLVGRAFNQEGGEGTGIVQVQVRRDLTDSDQDGVPDVDDDCPDVVGAPEWNGCTPEAAGAIGEAWSPGGNFPPDDGVEEAAGFEEGGHEGSEVPPSEDPPVHEPDPDPPEPEPIALVEVEALNLISAIGARDVYCYLTLNAQPVERVPDDAEGAFVELGFPGEWNISEYMSGDRGRMVEVPEAGPLHMELDCWGHFSDDPLEPDVRHMGIISVDHDPGDWDGRELFARGEMDANWFDLTYRICQGSCEATTLPAPYNLTIAPVGPDYELSWNWDEDPVVDNSDVGFYVYRNGAVFSYIPNHAPLNLIVLPPAEVVPTTCDQENRFNVRAVRGADIQLSDSSNPIWTTFPGLCAWENFITIMDSYTLRDSWVDLQLEYLYTLSHTERVMVGAMPTIGGELADEELFSWHGTSVSGGPGSSYASVFYLGSEPFSTDGLRLFMITVDDGVLPGGDIIYERDVPFEITWQPGVPDLLTARLLYPEDDDILRVLVVNNGFKTLEDWTPTFAFFQDEGGVRTRVDALDSPPGLPPETLAPFHGAIISWPGWTPAQFALLQPIFEMEVDPDNLVPEFIEENNIYPGNKPNIQVTLETIRVLDHASSDAAGFGGCFVGLSGSVAVPPSYSGFAFGGFAEKATYPTAFNMYYPHEIGLLVCPPQDLDVETELIPALMQESCPSACSTYFAAHGQPIFAEAKHEPLLVVPAWGSDYCSACNTLAGQTWITQDTNAFTAAYAGGELTFRVYLDNANFLYDKTFTADVVCIFDGVIPAADMAALPLSSYTITDPAGQCEIVVSIETYP